MQYLVYKSALLGSAQGCWFLDFSFWGDRTANSHETAVYLLSVKQPFYILVFGLATNWRSAPFFEHDPFKGVLGPTWPKIGP